MDYAVGYLLALGVIAAGFLGVILALIVLEVSKPKFVVSLILSLILIGLGGYYYYVVGLTEKGVANPNVLNSLLKVSAEAPAGPAMFPATPPMEMASPAMKEKMKSEQAPIEVKVKESTKSKRR